MHKKRERSRYEILRNKILLLQYQYMPGDTYDRTCACPYTCKIPSTSEKPPVLTSLAIAQSHVPYTNLVVATVTLIPITFCFPDSALSCFILNDIFNTLQQQETLHFGYKNPRLHVQLQII